MNRRNLLLAGGLLFAAWLAFFADPPKTDEISPAVERKSTRTQRAEANRPAPRANTGSSTRANSGPRSKANSGANAESSGAVVILALKEREALFGAALPESPNSSKEPQGKAALLAGVSKAEKTERADKANKTDKAEKTDKPNKTDKANKADKIGTAAAPGKPGQPGKPVAKPEPVAEALFDSQTWTPPPPPPPKPTPPPPPVAPPLAFTVIGKKLEDGKWEVFLARSAQIFIAQEQAMLDSNPRVASLNPPTPTTTYAP